MSVIKVTTLSNEDKLRALAIAFRHHMDQYDTAACVLKYGGAIFLVKCCSYPEKYDIFPRQYRVTLNSIIGSEEFRATLLRCAYFRKLQKRNPNSRWRTR